MRARARVTVRRARQVRTLARLRSKRDLLGTHSVPATRLSTPCFQTHPPLFSASMEARSPNRYTPHPGPQAAKWDQAPDDDATAGALRGARPVITPGF